MSYPGYELNQYQRDALRTARVRAPVGTSDGDMDLAIDALGVAGEAGEVADLVKKVVGHGHPLDREKLAKELGDVLWYVANIAHRINYTLGDVAEMNIEKLRQRYPSGFKSSDSINRKD